MTFHTFDRPGLLGTLLAASCHWGYELRYLLAQHTVVYAIVMMMMMIPIKGIQLHYCKFYSHYCSNPTSLCPLSQYFNHSSLYNILRLADNSATTQSHTSLSMSILMLIFSWPILINFWSLHSTTIPEALSSFVNKNHGFDNGSNNNNL